MKSTHRLLYLVPLVFAAVKALQVQELYSTHGINTAFGKKIEQFHVRRMGQVKSVQVDDITARNSSNLDRLPRAWRTPSTIDKRILVIQSAR